MKVQNEKTQAVSPCLFTAAITPQRGHTLTPLQLCSNRLQRLRLSFSSSDVARASSRLAIYHRAQHSRPAQHTPVVRVRFAPCLSHAVASCPLNPSKARVLEAALDKHLTPTGPLSDLPRPNRPAGLFSSSKAVRRPLQAATSLDAASHVHTMHRVPLRSHADRPLFLAFPHHPTLSLPASVGGGAGVPVRARHLLADPSVDKRSGPEASQIARCQAALLDFGLHMLVPNLRPCRRLDVIPPMSLRTQRVE